MFRPDRLASLRTARQLTQPELSDLSGIPRNRITKYENGYSPPIIENLIALAQALGTTTDYLCGLTDDPLPVSKRERAVLDALRKHYP